MNWIRGSGRFNRLPWFGLAIIPLSALVWASGGGTPPAEAVGENSIELVDTFATGTYTSVALDTSARPVIAYGDVNNGLMVAHCNDAACAGFNESLQTVDSGAGTDVYTSMVLDASGYPVVSYYSSEPGDLKLLHCNDTNCQGGDESLTAPDTTGDVGFTTSLALDSSGFPVISYWDVTNGDLKVIHCNDANCSGGGENIASPDTTGNVGEEASLELDSSGFPVVSYYDRTNGNLKLLHCDDPNCTGGGESISSPDTSGDVGRYTSLELDANGFPVVAYHDIGNEDLKVMHCNDVNCSGGGESITSPDTTGAEGQLPSLQLDATGRPVISYYDAADFDLNLLHCDDANCAGVEAISIPDSAGFTGNYSSLALDASGFPVVSYQDITNGNLKLLHCGTADCVEPPVCPGDGECDGFSDVAPTAHQGPANTNTAVDNCFAVANPTQVNNDGNFIDTTGPLTQDDTSRPNSDAAGDVCDPDDDNDGLTDVAEAGLPGAGCPAATGALDPMHPDSDGDGAMDGAECAIGTNPNNPSAVPVGVNKPTADQCRLYAGAATVPTDTDGDQIQDRVEACGYGTSTSAIESDGDTWTDGCEVGSLNTLPAVNSGDQLLLSQAIVADLGGPFVWNADLNKDGANNSGDQLLLSGIIMVGGCPTAPAVTPTPTPTPTFTNTPTATLTSSCFGGETLISMADGSARRIDSLAVGDVVLAWDVEAGQAIEGRVADVYARTSARHLVVGLASGDELRVTPEHPFFDPATEEYREIKTFDEGDAVAVAGDGGALVETAIASVRWVQEPLTVYNLHVDAPSHNYFANGVLVHNKTPTHTPTATPTP